MGGYGLAGQGLGQASGLQQQGLSNYTTGLGLQNQYGQQGLGNYLTGLGTANQFNQQGYQNLGSFLGQPSMAQLSGFIPPVSADRSSAYINPNAGFQGASYGLQNYQNLLGASQLGQNYGGNPWMSALGAVGSTVGAVAPYLAAFGG
jgi:hypothetical protein